MHAQHTFVPIYLVSNTVNRRQYYRILTQKCTLVIYFIFTGNCYHHYDGCIVPQPDNNRAWYSKAVNFVSSIVLPGIGDASNLDTFKCRSLLYYLKEYSDLQGPGCLEVLSQPNALHIVEHISAIYTQIKDLHLCDASYHSVKCLRCENVSQVC